MWMKTGGNFIIISSNIASVLFLSTVLLLCCSTTNQTNVRNDKLAARLMEIRYDGLNDGLLMVSRVWPITFGAQKITARHCLK